MIEEDNTEIYRKTVPASRIIDCGDHKLIMHCIVGKYYPWIDSDNVTGGRKYGNGIVWKRGICVFFSLFFFFGTITTFFSQ